MKAEQLRKSILQMAIQGKLVPQDPNDEPASVLLEKIRAEKQKLIKEGKIKKDKCDSVIFKGDDNRHYEKVGGEVKNITEEITFEIPVGWVYIRLSSIAVLGSGFTPKPSELCTQGSIPYFKVADMNTVGNEKYLSVSCNFYIGNAITKIFPKNSIVFPKNGGAVFTNKKRILLQDSVVDLNTGVFAPSRFILFDYAFLLFSSIDFRKHFKGTALPTVNNDFMESLLFALPPLAEQSRIVEAIEKYEPLIAEYDKLEKEATALDNTIKDKLKKSILQYAIQGKLVQQDENDEPASVLLERIRTEKKAKLGKKYVDSYIYKGDDNCYYEHIDGKAEDTLLEVPFALPNNWCFARLKSIVNLLTDGTHSTPKYAPNGIPFISVKDLSSGKLLFGNTKFISEEEHRELSKRCNPCKGDILLTKVGTTGIPVLIDTDKKFSLFVSVALLKFNDAYLVSEYFIYLLKSPLVQEQATENTRGVGNKNWVLSDIEKTLLVIPPLAEQQRIVYKIDEIFAKL